MDKESLLEELLCSKVSGHFLAQGKGKAAQIGGDGGFQFGSAVLCQTLPKQFLISLRFTALTYFPNSSLSRNLLISCKLLIIKQSLFFSCLHLAQTVLALLGHMLPKFREQRWRMQFPFSFKFIMRSSFLKWSYSLQENWSYFISWHSTYRKQQSKSWRGIFTWRKQQEKDQMSIFNMHKVFQLHFTSWASWESLSSTVLRPAENVKLNPEIPPDNQRKGGNLSTSLPRRWKYPVMRFGQIYYIFCLSLLCCLLTVTSKLSVTQLISMQSPVPPCPQPPRTLPSMQQ